MKTVFSVFGFTLIVLLMSGFTSARYPHRERQSMVLANKPLVGRITVGDAKNSICVLNNIGPTQAGFSSPVFNVEFMVFKKNPYKEDKKAVDQLLMRSSFTIQKYGQEDYYFGRMLNQNLETNEQPTTLQVFYDGTSNKTKIVYYSSKTKYIVCKI